MSYVDESLFGDRASARAKTRRMTGSSVVSGHRSARDLDAPPPGAAFISRSYLNDLRKRASDTTVSLHARPESVKRIDAPDAAMRKTRIAAADEARRRKEAARAARAEVSQSELEADIAREAIMNPALANAHLAEVEEMDEIKAFNVHIGRARAMKEVKVQVQERKMREAKEKRRVKLIERRMAKDRNRAIEEEHRREVLKREKERQAAIEIKQQLDAREFERLLEMERREVEGQQLKEAIERAVKEDELKAKRLQEKRRLMLQETLKQNEENQKLKAAEREKEIRRDKALQRYQRKKAKEEEARLEKIEAERQERERMFAKMRAEQERIADTRGEEDAARARKHQEQRILAERRALAEKEAKRKALMDEVDRDREMQIRYKQEEKLRERERERAQIRVIRRQQKIQAARELAEVDAVREAALRQQDDVLEQISKREAARKQKSGLKYKEAERIARANAERAIRIKMLKEQKLRELAAEGIGEEEQRLVGLLHERKVRDF